MGVAYQEGATPSRREKHRSAWGKKSSLTATHLHPLLIMPRPLLGCYIKAKIKGFLLVYRLFQYKHWNLPNFVLKHFLDSPFTPCTKLLSSALHLRVKQHTLLNNRVSHFLHAVKPINNEVKTKSFFSDNSNYVSLNTCGCKRHCFEIVLLQGRSAGKR